jgi:hypothetical protein
MDQKGGDPELWDEVLDKLWGEKPLFTLQYGRPVRDKLFTYLQQSDICQSQPIIYRQSRLLCTLPRHMPWSSELMDAITAARWH